MKDEEQQNPDTAPEEASGKTPGGEKPSGGLGSSVAKTAVGATETGRKVQETAEKVNRVRRLGQHGLSLIKSVAGFLLNPYFWLVAAVIVIILWLIATTIAANNVIGRNENIDGCIPSENGGSGVAVVAATSPDENLNQVGAWLTTTKFDFLGGQPMSREQAAGVIGNFGAESMGNPAITQGGWGSASMSNDEMMRVSGGGKAIGLAQWDGNRRKNLARFAKDNGGHWSDLQIQLEFLKHELETSEASMLKSKGFTDAGKDVKHYVTAFQEAFERAGKPNYPARFAAADNFMQNFNGGYTSNTGGGCVTAVGKSQYSGEIAQLAADLAYPKGSGNIIPPTPEYRQAKIEAEAATVPDGTNLYASCDRFVATVLKLTVDPDVPWGPTAAQHQYFENSPKWEKYNDASQRQPGDVWITGGSGGSGHVIIHVDENTIAHASLGQRSGLLTPLEGYFTGMRDNFRPKPYDGYRFVG